MSVMERAKMFATGYDRESCAIGVVHVGYGAFHRAHQAVYFDDYMERTGDLGWGIAAVNLRASESCAFDRARLAGEGYILKCTGTETPPGYRLVRPHIAFADWSREAGEAEALVALESVNVITVTVTESGYCLDAAGNLDVDAPVIRAELDGTGRQSVYAYLAAALERRRVAGGRPLSVMCCDNIRGNGRMLERCLLAYLGARRMVELERWVRARVSFPCSMVDRITPRGTPELDREVAGLFPGRDLAPVHSEDYLQWVLEDRFAGVMADLGVVGVEMVGDVDPYEEAKIRILNGGHTGLAYLGALGGCTTFDEAMRHPALRAHFDELARDEILPGLAMELPFDKSAYSARVTQRFTNRAIADTLERICMDGFAKFPIFIRPTMRDCLGQGLVPARCCLAAAGWYVFARRHAGGRARIPYHEPNWHLLESMLREGEETRFASSTALWGELAAGHADFVPRMVRSIREVQRLWPE